MVLFCPHYISDTSKSFNKLKTVTSYFNLVNKFYVRYVLLGVLFFWSFVNKTLFSNTCNKIIIGTYAPMQVDNVVDYWYISNDKVSRHLHETRRLIVQFSSSHSCPNPPPPPLFKITFYNNIPSFTRNWPRIRLSYYIL